VVAVELTENRPIEMLPEGLVLHGVLKGAPCLLECTQDPQPPRFTPSLDIKLTLSLPKTEGNSPTQEIV